MSLLSKDVLVDGDNFGIGQYVHGLLRQLGNITTDEQRRFRQGPQREMGNILGSGHPSVS